MRSGSRSIRAWDARRPSSTATSPGPLGLSRGRRPHSTPSPRRIEFCERRGIADVGLQMRVQRSRTSWRSSARPEQALAEAGRLAERLEAARRHRSRSTCALMQLRLLAERGSPEQARDARRARRSRPRDRLARKMIAIVLAAAAQTTARPRPTRAGARAPARPRRARRGPTLPTPAPVVRDRARSRRPSARRAISPDTSNAMETVDRGTPWPRPRAQLAEAAGDHAAAALLYEEAAERWQQFGHVPERAYALLGQGRCLHALARRRSRAAAAHRTRAVRADGLPAGARRDRGPLTRRKLPRISAELPPLYKSADHNSCSTGNATRIQTHTNRRGFRCESFSYLYSPSSRW